MIRLRKLLRSANPNSQPGTAAAANESDAWLRFNPLAKSSQPDASTAANEIAFRSVYERYPEIDKWRIPEQFPDIQDRFFWRTFEKCKSYSLLGIEPFYNLYRSIEYLAANRIAGDFVECGVFLGGAVLAMSDFAFHFGLRNRRFYLYDTFTGFPEKTSEVDLRGNKVEFEPHSNFLETVRGVISRSLCSADQFEIVQGMVEDTLPRTRPRIISLLRLDTDYYKSTRVELDELYPLLSSGGVLIVDDYGLFQGARKATDEFLRRQHKKPLLTRVNFSVRTGVKP